MARVGIQRAMPLRDMSSWVAQAGMTLCHRLEDFLEQEEAGPRGGPYRLAQAIHALVSAHLRLLQSPDLAELKGLRRANHMRAVAGFLISLYPYVEIAEGAAIGYVPPGLAAWVEEAADRISPEFRVIFAPTWRYNFHLVPVKQNLKETLAKQPSRVKVPQDVLEGYPEYLSVLQVPQSMVRDYLAYAMCAHELGHVVEVVHDVLAEVGGKVPVDASELSSLAKGVLDLPMEDIQERIKGIQETLADRVNWWLQELIADYLAVALVGPAYLLAFEEFVLMRWGADHLDREGHYPPPWLRVGVIAKAVKRLGYYQAMGQALDRCGDSLKPHLDALRGHIDDWERVLLSFKPAQMNPDVAERELADGVLTLALYRHLSELDYISERDWLQTLRYDADSLSSHLVPLCEDLEERIPPCQVHPNDGMEPPNRPAPFASIINAAALHRFKEERQRQGADVGVRGPVDLEEEFKRRKLDYDLVVKAFELSDIHRRFDAFRRLTGVSAVGCLDAGTTQVTHYR